MKKLKFELSSNLGEVLNKKELQAIVGGCKVIGYYCHCSWDSGNHDKTSERRSSWSDEECRSFCADYCIDFFDCTPTIFTKVKSCGRNCGSFGSGSGS